MEFAPIDYLNWAKTSFHGGKDWLDLASSGFPSRPIEDLSPPAEALQITAPNAYGLPDLRTGIGQHHGLDASNTAIAAGASMANFLAVMSLVSRGDTVLVEAPAYEPLTRLPELLGTQVARWNRPASGDWDATGNALDEALARTQAKLVVFTNPHNPSGRMLPPNRVMELVEVCQKYRAVLLMDEVYAEFHESWDPQALAEATKAGLLVRTSSLTKVMGFGPLRIGWVLASEEQVNAILQLTNYTYAVHGAINERLGDFVWLERYRFVEEARRRAEFNLNIVRRFISSRQDISWVDPEAGILGFLRIHNAEDTTAFAHYLRDELGVLVVPGHFFGEPQYIRIGFGQPSDIVRKGLTLLGKALHSLN